MFKVKNFTGATQAIKLPDGTEMIVEPTEYSLKINGQDIETANFHIHDVDTLATFKTDDNESELWVTKNVKHASMFFKLRHDLRTRVIGMPKKDIMVTYIHPDVPSGLTVKPLVIYKPEIFNFCPHDVHLYNANGSITTYMARPFEGDKYWCRCSEALTSTQTIGGIKFVSVKYDLDNETIPEHNPDLFQIWIVSNITEAVMRDLQQNEHKFPYVHAVYPTDLVRNEKKQIEGCKAFADTL